MKFTRTNMSEPIRKALSEVNIQTQYFVDAVNGDDANDGATSSTAFKTLDRLSAELIGKMHTYTHVTIMEGVYDDGLAIYDTTGNIYITGEGNVTIQGLSPRGKISGAYASVYMTNNSSVISLNNIKFNHDSVSEEDKVLTHYVIYANKTSKVILSGCDIDTIATKGLRSDTSPVALYAKNGTDMSSHTGSIKNCGIAVYADYGAFVATSNITFEDILDGYAPMYGGIVNMSNYDIAASKIPRATWATNYSIDTIEEGVIIESGTNENGTYYKYKNGLLVCTVTALNFGPGPNQIGTTGLYSTNKKEWIYPHDFTEIPVISGMPSTGAGNSWITLSDVALQSHKCDLVAMRVVGSEYDEICNIVAIGRWK